jgi:hypothetical protein
MDISDGRTPQSLMHTRPSFENVCHRCPKMRVKEASKEARKEGRRAKDDKK